MPQVRFGLLLAVLLLSLSPLTTEATAMAKLKCGLVDGHGKTVIPCRYKSIHYIGAGLYMVQKFDPTNGASDSYDWMLFDHTGKEIKVPIPVGYSLCNAYLPDRAKSKVALKSLPEGTILKVHSGSFNLCNLHQKLLLPKMQFDRIEPLSEGMFDVGAITGDPPDNKNYLFNSSSGKLIALKSKQINQRFKSGRCAFQTYGMNQTSGILDKDGNALWEGQYDFIGPLDKEEIIIRSKIPVLAPPSKENPDGSDYTTPKIAILGKTGQIKQTNFDGMGAFVDGYTWAILGQRCGLVNKQLEFVTPDIYSECFSIADGMYAARHKESKRLAVLDSRGQTLFKLPTDIIKLELNSFSVPPVVGVIKSAEERPIYAVFDNRGEVIWRGTKEDLEQYRYKCATPKEKILQKLVNGISQPEPDRTIKIETEDKFIPRDWKDEETKNPFGIYYSHAFDRFDQFVLLIRDYNIINMQEDKIYSLIGKPAYGSRYHIRSGPCGNGNSVLEIEYKSSRVARWRIVNPEERNRRYDSDPKSNTPWFENNMIWTDNEFKAKYQVKGGEQKKKL